MKIEITKSFMATEQQAASFKEITAEIWKQAARFGELPHLVLTGGEPLVQQAALVELFNSDPQMRSFFVEVETNGTIKPSEAMAEIVSQFNVSPKLENSGNTLAQRRNLDALGWHAKSGKSLFKFVVQEKYDLDEVNEIVDLVGIDPSNVYLMPEGIEAEVIQERSAKLIEICKKLGYNFTTRLHVLVYGGAKRGV